MTENLQPNSRARFGAVEFAILALGLAVRAWFIGTGRAVLDGDEGIMGVMAYHLSRLEHAPLYFYRQHYMGTLEVPPVSLLMLFGPDAWKFSIWPLRIAEAGFFAALCFVHFHLAARFFGRGAARWALFFLVVGPVYWIDYTLRLRHAIAMMLVGELIALLAVHAIDDWRERKRARPGLMFAIGALIGIGWWHYQLVAIYFIAAGVLFLLSPAFVADWVRRTNFWTRRKEGELPMRFDAGAFLRFAVMAACAGLLFALALGVFANPPMGYPSLIGVVLSIFALAVFGSWRSFRLGKQETKLAAGGSALRDAPLHRFGAALLFIGIVAGYAPSLIYLVGLNEEFWVAGVEPRWNDLLGRARDLFMLEISAILEITAPGEEGSWFHTIDARSFVVLGLAALGFYFLARKAVAPAERAERAGAIYFLILLGVLVLLHVFTPRATLWTNPRFLVPIFAVTSAAYGLAADSIVRALAGLAKKRAREVGIGLSMVLASGAFALWAPRWFAIEPEEIRWPGGHREKTMAFIDELDRRGIKRVRFPHGTEGVLFSYELQFASGLRIRFNQGTMGDRLIGIVDETQYEGVEYRVRIPNANRWQDIELGESEETPRAGFVFREYVLEPADSADNIPENR